MKIGILYICTGKYSIFWRKFYDSAEHFFLPDTEKHYFVFTDSIEILETKNIHVRYESPKGFPLDSLMRFEMFLSVKDQLSEMDYVFFFNSNMQFMKSIGYEIIPSNVKSNLVALLQPGLYLSDRKQYPYERNKKSSAYIPFNNASIYHYYMGSLNGGKTDAFMELCEECGKNIREDLKNGYIAIFHDESHLNFYLHGKDVLGLDPSFGYPEDSVLPFEPKILILDKIKHGGKYFDKVPQKSYSLRLYLRLKRIYSALIWKFQ